MNLVKVIGACAALFVLLVSSVSQGSLPSPAAEIADRISKQALETNAVREYAPGRVLVRFRKHTPSGLKASARGILGTRVQRQMKVVPGLERLDIGMAVPQAVAYLRGLPFVEFAEPDYVLKADRIPNDVSFTQQWGLHNTGQTVNGSTGSAGADINMPQAWEITTGNGSTVIAVIDTGVQWNHPDLNANIWRNTGEIAGNGIDDDRNGYIDDIRGWDFYSNDNNPDDYGGHGTHVAGSICAAGNNGEGVTGVLWNCRIMPLRFMGDNGGYTSDAIEAIEYAVDNGARISSNSWGNYSYSVSLYNAISNAAVKGHIFVAAAGNDGLNNDWTPHYPASYTLSNIISVAATNSRDSLASFSNYGVTTVDVAAPGVDIYSTYKDSSYRFLNGTSMATPHVTGLVALVREQNPGWGYQQVISRVLDTTRSLSSLQGKTVSGGIINAQAAIGGNPPAPPSSCGEPAYDRATESALFVWQDCTDGSWHTRVTAGGQSLNYVGTINSSLPFSSVSPFMLLPPDVLDYSSDPSQIDFSFFVGNSGQDGLDFSFPTTASVCFGLDAPPGTPLLLGAARTPMTVPFDLGSLGPCGTPPPPSSCGEPAYDRATESALFVWQDCTDGSWHTRVTAGGQSLNYVGTINSSLPFSSVSPFMLLPPDVLDYSSDPSQIDFSFFVGNSGQDGLDFSFPTTASVCFGLDAPPGTPLLLGAARTPMTVPFDLGSLGPCGTPPPPSSCGEPAYDRATESALFVWQDCTDGSWHTRVTAGGQSLNYVGTINSSLPFSSVSPFMLLPPDVLDYSSDPSQIDFSFFVGNSGQDGLDFSFPTTASVCFGLDAPPGTPLLLGAARTPMTVPFDLGSLGSCL